jgi:NAD(P)-dependent dehydrogenase (short-subunit alcohol dehydrogenase family)
VASDTKRYSVADKVVFITGACRGLGAATATALTRRGAGVVLADIDPAAAQGVAATSRTSVTSDSGPRLLEIVAETPLLPSARATLEPRPPEPMMPMLISCFCC